MILDDLLNLEGILALPPLEYHIQDLLPKTGLLVVGGPPKLGKSRLALDTILRAVGNRRALGEFACRDVNRALLMNAEGGCIGMRERADMLVGIPQDVLQRVMVTGKRPCLTQSNRQPNVRVFQQLIEEWSPYDIVVIDPLVSFHAADENDNQQMGALMDAIRDTARAANTSVIVVHHTSKISDDEMLMMAKSAKGGKLRGASAVHAAADNVIVAWPSPNGLSLVFDLRYGKPIPDGRLLVCDSITGRFYRQFIQQPSKSRIPDARDWSEEWGRDVQRFMKAFGLPLSTAMNAMKEIE